MNDHQDMKEWLEGFMEQITETQAETTRIQKMWDYEAKLWEYRFWLLFGNAFLALGLMMVWMWTR
jgi:hypothetical protein